MMREANAPVRGCIRRNSQSIEDSVAAMSLIDRDQPTQLSIRASGQEPSGSHSNVAAPTLSALARGRSKRAGGRGIPHTQGEAAAD